MKTIRFLMATFFRDGGSKIKLAGCICCFFSFLAVQNVSHATIIDFVGINNAFGTLGVQGQINDKLPSGATFEIAPGIGLVVEAGASTFGDLTVTGGPGFVLNFDQAVSSVRIRFSDNKDENYRYLRAYGSNISSDGPFPGEIDFNSLTVYDNDEIPGNEFYNLTVSDPLIRAVRVTSGSAYLWAVNEIEFDMTAVPEPSTMFLLGIGLAGLAGGAVRRKWKKRAVEKSQIIF